VSNVLNRPDTVRPGTRARVEEAIASLGYVRNESARQLRVGMSTTLACLALDAGNPFFTDLAKGVDEVARQHGLTVYLCDSDQDAAREHDYLVALLHQRVRGVCITPVNLANPMLRTLVGQGIPVVLLDRVDPSVGSQWCSVGVDDHYGGKVATSHLIERGHRRVGFIGGPDTIVQVADRLAGARAAVTEAGDGHNLTVISTGGLTVADGQHAAARLLGLPKRARPTAVFCANDLVALGVLQQLTQHGVSVPDDVAIVGYDDIIFAAAAAVPLTSVYQPRLELGRTAAELVVDEADNPMTHRHQQVVFQPELVVRQSTGEK
jgi:LacI family transcriptional regulator